MSITGSSRSGFGRSYSAWQVNEAWRARRRDMAQIYRDQSTMAQSALAGAWSSQIEGSASLAAQAAITRIKAATQAVAKTAADLKI
jgi:hypothetical protein